jgi:hypothetical protein
VVVLIDNLRMDHQYNLQDTYTMAYGLLLGTQLELHMNLDRGQYIFVEYKLYCLHTLH